MTISNSGAALDHVVKARRAPSSTLLAFVPAALAVPIAVLALRVSSPAWALEYYPNTALAGVALQRRVHVAGFDSRLNALAPGLPERDGFSIRLRTCLVPAMAGLFRFRMTVDGGARLLVDDELLIDVWTPVPARTEERVVELDAGQHVITIEFQNDVGPALLGTEMAFPAHYALRPISGTSLPDSRGECTSG